MKKEKIIILSESKEALTKHKVVDCFMDSFLRMKKYQSGIYHIEEDDFFNMSESIAKLFPNIKIDLWNLEDRKKVIPGILNSKKCNHGDVSSWYALGRNQYFIETEKPNRFNREYVALWDYNLNGFNNGIVEFKNIDTDFFKEVAFAIDPNGVLWTHHGIEINDKETKYRDFLYYNYLQDGYDNYSIDYKYTLEDSPTDEQYEEEWPKLLESFKNKRFKNYYALLIEITNQ